MWRGDPHPPPVCTVEWDYYLLFSVNPAGSHKLFIILFIEMRMEL